MVYLHHVHVMFIKCVCFSVQLFQLQTALRDANIVIYGGERSCKYLSLPTAPSPRHEYGTAALTLELVESMDDAIDHLHANGSGHTECIVTGGVFLQSLRGFKRRRGGGGGHNSKDCCGGRRPAGRGLVGGEKGC